MFNPLRLFSFSDWNRNHPSDQPPGDRLDEAFDSTARALQEVDYKLSELRRSDGALNNGIVTHDSLSPNLVGVLASEIKAALQSDVETVKSLASGIASAHFVVSKEAEKASLAAHAAAEKARFVEDRLPALLSTVGRSTDVAYELLGRVEARAADIVNDANDAQYWGNYAYSWGQVSYNWAEYMAGPIPPDILATMGISGNHWSSRWWANEATIAVGDAEDWAQQAADSAASAAAALDQMTDLYLGPHPSNPTVDNDGNPLQVGAIYYNTSDHNMYVWTGTVWQVSNNSQGWVPEAPVDSRVYSRSNAAWVVSAGGVGDAPNNGLAYARKSVAWSQLTSDDMLFGAGPGMVTGAINLKASQVSLDTETAARIAGDQANLSTIQGLKASQVANDSSVTGTTVKDALNTTAAGIASNTSAIALKADISAMNLKAPLASPAFTGDPTAPTPAPGDNDLSIPNTAWVNSAVSGALALKPSVIVNATPPVSPIDNAMWWESDTGYLFLRYNDGNSAQWVQLNGIPAAQLANYATIAQMTAGDALAVQKSGDSMSGALTITAPYSAGNPQLVINPASSAVVVNLNKPASGVANVIYGLTNGSTRWNLILGNGAAESGSNAGSDFGITRFTDAGASIDTVFSITRSSGLASFTGGVTSATSFTATGSLIANNIAQVRNVSPAYYCTNAAGTVNWGTFAFISADSSIRMTNIVAANNYALLDSSGNFIISGNGFKPSGGSWGVSSDVRIKTVEGDYKQGLADVLALHPVVYRYKGNDTPTAELDAEDMSIAPDSKDTPKRKLRSKAGGPATASPHYHAAKAQTPYVGLIAQEVDKIFPGMVTKRKGFIDGKAVEDFHDLDTSQLIFALVNAVKELSLKVSNLEAGAR